ncbi:FAD-binding protein, partial [Pseudomonas aeruginosa]
MSQPYFDPDAGADHAGALLERVRDALARRAPLRIVGGDSKAFLGRPVAGEPLALAEHRGIVAYDPCELVITARAGTPLDELQAVLARGGQMLACEAPGFGGRATVGGVLASGLSGPRRPWAGAVRDFVLGTRLISGLGTHLRFGGEVMKNVAGYDLSRLLAGSFGCLG